MRFDEGYGFQGVLLFDGKTEEVQCHFCGQWFFYLPKHIRKEHNMTAAQYKEQVGLRKSACLLTESTRERLIAVGMENRLKNLRPGGKKKKAVREKIRATLKNVTRQAQNERGTCPAQLIQRLRAVTDKLGRTPKVCEVPFHGSLKTVFGSMERALRLAGLERRKVGHNIKHHDGYLKSTDKELIALLVNFKEVHGREPSMSDYNRRLVRNPNLYKRRFGSWSKAKEIAFGKV